MGNNYTLIFVKYRILLLNAIEKIEAGEDDEVELENPLNVDDDTSKSYIGFMKHYYNQTNYSKKARADSNDSEEESDMQIPVEEHENEEENDDKNGEEEKVQKWPMIKKSRRIEFR